MRRSIARNNAGSFSQETPICSRRCACCFVTMKLRPSVMLRPTTSSREAGGSPRCAPPRRLTPTPPTHTFCIPAHGLYRDGAVRVRFDVRRVSVGEVALWRGEAGAPLLRGAGYGSSKGGPRSRSDTASPRPALGYVGCERSEVALNTM